MLYIHVGKGFNNGYGLKSQHQIMWCFTSWLLLWLLGYIVNWYLYLLLLLLSCMDYIWRI